MEEKKKLKLKLKIKKQVPSERTSVDVLTDLPSTDMPAVPVQPPSLSLAAVKKIRQQKLEKRRVWLLKSNSDIVAWKNIFTGLDPILINRLLKSNTGWVLEVAAKGLVDPSKAWNGWFIQFHQKMLAIGEEDCRKNIDNLYHFVLES
jgi:hypothetical protein